MRTAEIKRKTAETDIYLYINLDGTGKNDIDTGCGFLNHMLTLFSAHSKFDLTVKCKGDTDVDYHHTVEDIGIALGAAIKDALGDTILTMDEAVILTSVDFSGRTFLGYSLKIPTEKVGDFDTELVEEFWYGFVRKAECSLHIKMLAGTNSHHIIEGAFKSAARSLRQATEKDQKFAGEIPSTKGVL